MDNDEYYDDEEFREMLNDYEEAVKSGGPVFMDADDLADIADYYQMHERFEEAEKAMRRAIELEPHSMVALSYQMREALVLKDFQAAEDYLAQMPDKDQPDYIYSRAEIWIAQGLADKADAYLRLCLEEDVADDEYQDYVMDVANLWAEYSNSEKAMEWMMRACPEDTEDFKELLGRTYFGMGDYTTSASVFNELIDKDPYQRRYWNALANAQYMNEDYQAAIDSSEYAIAIDQNDLDAILTKANALFRLEEYEEALKFYERYAEQERDEYVLLYQGCCLVYLKRHQEAIERLEEAEKAAPPHSPYLAEIYQEMAFVYNELGMPEAAFAYIDKTDALDCDHADMMVIRAHIMLSRRREEEAEELFKQAIRLSGYSPKVVMRVAVSVYDNHYLEMAYRLFRKYFNMSDFSMENLCTDGYAYMALCCHDLKRFDEYLLYLKIACTRNPMEAKQVLGHLFPKEFLPKEYHAFAQKALKQ